MIFRLRFRFAQDDTEGSERHDSTTLQTYTNLTALYPLPTLQHENFMNFIALETLITQLPIVNFQL